MQKFNDFFDAFDATGGTYSARKVPEWNGNTVEIVNFVNNLNVDALDDSLSRDPAG